MICVMKSVLFLMFLVLICNAQPTLQFSTNSSISQYRIVWENNSFTNLGGFYAYIGTNKIDCGLNTSYDFYLTGCVPVCAVSAYDINRNETPLAYESNNIVPRMLQLNTPSPVIIGSTNLRDWYDVTNVLVPCNKPREFFRVIQ